MKEPCDLFSLFLIFSVKILLNLLSLQKTFILQRNNLFHTMMKALKFILAVLSIATSSVSYAHDFEADGIYYNFESNNTVSVTYEGNDHTVGHAYIGDVIIPSSIIYNGATYSVTSIGNFAFDYSRGLTSITIPNSVTSIGSGAFHLCEQLTSTVIGNSVTTIGNNAFNGCKRLTSINIPNSVTKIGDYAFYSCDSLASITIGKSVTSIGKSAFQFCKGLTSITIPNSVTKIGAFAFACCEGLTSIAISNSVTIIESHAFGGLIGLTSVTIPNSVTSIGEGAFSGCIGLTSITIPNSVINIGNLAFSNCTSLESTTIPNSVTDIGLWVFDSCNALKALQVLAITPPFASPHAFANYYDNHITIPSQATLYVPRGCYNAYHSDDTWGLFPNIVESSFKKGDVDLNEEVDSSDITTLINDLLNINSVPFFSADINADNVVNVSDISELITIITTQ